MNQKSLNDLIARAKEFEGYDKNAPLAIPLTEYAHFASHIRLLAEPRTLTLADWRYIDNKCVSEIRQSNPL